MDVAVTVPKSFGLDRWIEEGDPAGTEWSGQEWGFYLGGHPPKIDPGERVYVFYNGLLRGYAPLLRIEREQLPADNVIYQARYALVRGGGAVAVTIDQHVPGFRGFRYRFWDQEAEKPFPDWMR